MPLLCLHVALPVREAPQNEYPTPSANSTKSRFAFLFQANGFSISLPKQQITDTHARKLKYNYVFSSV